MDERRWMRFGCATRPVPNMPEAKASRKCDAAETGLSLTGAAKLNSVMPGAGGNSCLERYEYAKHGVCFGFDPDAYFGTMVRMNREVKHSAAGKFLAENYGKSVRRSDFDAAVAKAGKTERKSVQAYLPRQSGLSDRNADPLNASTINNPLSAGSFAPQPHPGNCGKQFVIDKAGY